MTIMPLRLRDAEVGLTYEYPEISKLVQRSVHIPNLPVELISNILTQLAYKDLLQCTLVCKLLYKLVHESSRLLYTLELAKSRMVSVLQPNDNPNFASRLELLRDREQAWRVLGWKHRRILDLPPTGSLYEFVGGVYGNGKEGDNRMTTSISFLELPSLGIPSKIEDVKPPTELQTWTHSMPDLSIIDFTMDPLQDLLVLVAVAPLQSEYIYELHVRSIKTNQPHEKAPVSVFPCLRKPGNHLAPIEVITAVRVQVCGDLVALLIKDVMENSGGHLEIWNWECGPTNSCTMPRTQGIDDFSFLTRDVALIVRPTGRFEVYDFKDPRTGSSIPVLRYVFAFPPLSPGYTYWYISMSNNPTPGYVPDPKDNNNMDGFLKGNRQIYYPNPKDRIHACCLYVFNPADPVLHQVSSFVFFVKIDTLLNPPFDWFDREPLDEDGSRAPYYHPSLFKGRKKFSDYYPKTLATSSKRAGKAPAVDSADASGSSGSGISIHAHSSGAPELPVHSYPESHTGSSSSASSPTVASPGHGASGSLNFLPLSEEILDSIPTFDPLPPPAPAPAPVPQPQTQAQAQAQTQTQPQTQQQQQPPQPPQPQPVPLPPQDLYEPVPWETWGPASTRWFEECLSTDWQHAIYGLRAVESVEVSKMTTERQFQIHMWPPGRGQQEEEQEVVSAMPVAGGSGAGASTDPGVGASASVVAGAGAQAQAGPSTSTTTTATTTTATTTNITTTTQQQAQARRERRFLRIRDFSPYAQTKAALSETKDHPVFQGRGKCRTMWRSPKVVTEVSRVPVNGVFKYDIMSSLPYVETVSDETYDVTDVMMDDSRVLLLKRGPAGRLKQLEVLMM